MTARRVPGPGAGNIGGNTMNTTITHRGRRWWRELARAARYPAVWIATAVIICLPNAAMRILASGASNPQLSDLLQNGARLLALALVLPLNTD